VLTTHYIEEAAQLCDRVLVMGAGRKLDEGPPAELVERHEQHDLEAVFFRLTA
jgi:lipooligosaccharide transport system ATP-binding protein